MTTDPVSALMAKVDEAIGCALDGNHAGLSITRAALRAAIEEAVAQPLTSHERYWVSIRGEVIDALRAEGLTIVTTSLGVRLMRLGKIEAQSAPPADAALKRGE